MPALFFVQAQSQQGDRHRDETNDSLTTERMGPKSVFNSYVLPHYAALYPPPFTSFNIHRSAQSRQLALWQRADENVPFHGQKERRETCKSLTEPVQFLLSNSSIT